MNEIRTTALFSAIMGFLGLISGAVSALFDPQNVVQNIVLYTSVGVFVGIMGAPAVSPEDFRYPGTQATLSGVMAGVLVGLLASEGNYGLAIGAAIGGLLGFLSPIWLKHFTF